MVMSNLVLLLARPWMNLSVVGMPCVDSRMFSRMSLPIVPVPVFGAPKIMMLCLSRLVMGTPPALVLVCVTYSIELGTLMRRRLDDWIS